MSETRKKQYKYDCKQPAISDLSIGFSQDGKYFFIETRQKYLVPINYFMTVINSEISKSKQPQESSI
ncbi:MAG: hypothetical protein ACK41T_02310 [Pseudobdellovibrio sp.]